MLQPDNFIYFITLFFICTSLGTYLLFSYKRNLLIILNAVACYLTAVRACTEYYLPQIDNFSTASNLAAMHSFLTTSISILFYYIVWFYIRPFRSWRQEALLNRLYLIVGLILPHIVIFYAYFYRKVFYFKEEKIDGYWGYKIDFDYSLTQPILAYQQLIGYSMILVFMVSIFRDKQHRFQKSLLAGSFLFFPALFHNYIFETREWLQPNFAILFAAHVIIITWFVSEYRLFENNFSGTLKDILNSISDLAIFTDLKMGILHGNNLAHQQFANNFSEKKNILELIANHSNETLQDIQGLIGRLIYGNNSNQELTLVFGKEVKKYKLQVADYNQGNQHQGYTFLLTDQTEIREKEQQLAAANDTKDRLFAIISHDLRKPALAFRGIAKKVKFLVSQNEFETLDKYGVALEKAAFSLNNLLDNLLNWALQQRSVLPYNPKPIDVSEVTQEIYDFFNLLAMEKGISMEMDIPESTVIFADSNAYTTIIRNLLDNAIKYTPVGGSIDLSAEQLNKAVLLKVKDTGIGIASTKIDALFDLKANKSVQGTEGEKGTGLGLTLVKDLVELNKGDIRVKSKWNEGTTFEVLLPRAG